MGEAAVLSARQVRRSIFFLLAAPVAWTIFGAASTGTLLIGLLRSVEMTKQEIGMVMSLTLIFLPMQLIGTYLQERFLHRKHFWEWCLFVYYSSFLLIAALVMEWGAFPAELAVLIFMLIFGGGQIAAQLQGAIALAWQGEIIPVREAFRRFANEDADRCAEEDARFEFVLVDRIEPALPKDRPCVLMDYPVRFGAFARPKASDPTLAERWEIYMGGLELANAYGELIDPQIQRARFRQFAETRKKMNLAEYPE